MTPSQTWTVYTTPRLFNDCEKFGLIDKANCKIKTMANMVSATDTQE
jgi:hypothetical protein